jgi:hypothetical protein
VGLAATHSNSSFSLSPYESGVHDVLCIKKGPAQKIAQALWFTGCPNSADFSIGLGYDCEHVEQRVNPVAIGARFIDRKYLRAIGEDRQLRGSPCKG